jgi:hypothetical protein
VNRARGFVAGRSSELDGVTEMYSTLGSGGAGVVNISVNTWRASGVSGTDQAFRSGIHFRPAMRLICSTRAFE